VRCATNSTSGSSGSGSSGTSGTSGSSGGSVKCDKSGPGTCGDTQALNHCNCGAGCSRNSSSAGSGYSCHITCRTDADCQNLYSFATSCHHSKRTPDRRTWSAGDERAAGSAGRARALFSLSRLPEVSAHRRTDSRWGFDATKMSRAAQASKCLLAICFLATSRCHYEATYWPIVISLRRPREALLGRRLFV